MSMSENNKTTLNPTLFLKMIFTGGKQIIQSENELNQLNVYPVPDGDTGSNMAALMRYVLAQKYPTNNFGELLSSLADASLIGSCGNSGMILSAFFVGLAKIQTLAEKTSISISEFVECLSSGVKQAHQSVAQPVEGTILTVMESWLTACVEQRESCDDFVTLFNATLPAAESALSQTEFLLPTLEENNVVDAGAFGFTKMIQGMEKALEDDTEFDLHWEDDAFFASDTSHAHIHAELAEDSYQYCMETLLSGNQEDLSPVHKKLSEFCDSIVLNQSPSHIKAHVHTTDIKRCTDLLSNYGNIIHQKIDDMKIQWAISEHRKHKVALVTDSSADLPQHILKDEQIHTIPMQVRLGEHSLLDRLSIDLPTLFEKAHGSGMKTSTAAPTAEVVRRYLHFLATHYDSIIVVTVSSLLSSTHQLIQNQADHLNGVKIDVVDSRSIAAGHGLLVMKAAKMLAAGNSHDKTVEELTRVRDNIKIYLAVNEMKPVRESGRATKLLTRLADWSQLKPILSLDTSGNPSVAGVAFGAQASLKKLTGIMSKLLQKASESTMLISHTATADKISSFTQLLEKTTGAKIKDICETAPSIGVHAGRGSIAVAVLNESI